MKCLLVFGLGKIVYFLIFLLFSTTFADPNVIYAAIIFRHGDRTPVDTYPTDPYQNESLWPVRFGELTNIGKNQHYRLGKWFRLRYLQLLSEAFDPTEIYIRSTDVDRTLMSAQANLAGMYPPNNNTEWNDKIFWQPIPVHTVPENEDEVLAMKKPCAIYERELEKFTHSKPYKQRLSKYQALMDYLTSNTGKEIRSYYDIGDIYSILLIESLNNFKLPNWTKSVFPDKMREPTGYSFTTQTGTPLLAKLKVGPLLKDIMTHMEDAMNATAKNRHKVTMYSGHDLTVGSVLNALGLYDGISPTYTSTILIELVINNKTNGHYVRISYRNTVDIEEPNVLNIPACGKLCPIEKFKKLYEYLLSVKFDDDCNTEFTTLLGVSFIIGLTLFMVIYFAHKIQFTLVRNQQKKNMIYSSVKTTAAPTKIFEV